MFACIFISLQQYKNKLVFLKSQRTYLEEVPQVHKVSCEHEFLRLGDEAVGHEAEILDQLGGSMNAGIHVQFGPSQQTQQQVVHLVEDHGGVRGQWKFTGRQVEGACGAEHLAK